MSESEAVLAVPATILELRERLAHGERNNPLYEALARQLALALQENVPAAPTRRRAGSQAAVTERQARFFVRN
jgi:hypothetical protein